MNELELFKKQIIRDNNQITEFISRLMHKNIILYGAGYCGHEVFNLLENINIDISSICDDDEKRIGTVFHGKKIEYIENAQTDKDTVILITSGFNRKMKDKLKQLGLISLYVDIDFGRYEAENENWQFFKDHEVEIIKAYNLLSDKKSKDLLIKLINYRISRKLMYLDNCEEKYQYFPQNEILKLTESEVFLDLGAFDGDSIKEFLKFVNGKYEKIIALEPNKVNYNKLLNNVGGLADIKCYNLGVYRENMRIKFLVDDTKNSFIDDSGTELIEVVSVDKFLNGDKVTFVKMDIEGSEYDAIQGAEETIRLHRPILAISIYHRVEDLFRIILLIDQINPNYKYYMRHYSPTVIETILYAVPVG